LSFSRAYCQIKSKLIHLIGLEKTTRYAGGYYSSSSFEALYAAPEFLMREVRRFFSPFFSRILCAFSMR
ncbi:hypothetical protein, partial [Bilophila wadsworthia]